MKKNATVLGAGIQGVCTALMLQKHGYHVLLIDKNWDIMNRASLTYEGKIHLGFVYGMDKSLLTGYKMVKDALHFAPYLDYLLDNNEDWGKLRSKPNIYLVVRDSMLPAHEAGAYFEKIDTSFQDCLQDESLHYLGQRPSHIFRKVDIPKYVNRDLIEASFLTEEVSVDQLKLKELLKEKISTAPSIDLFTNHRVTEIKAVPSGFVVECQKVDGSKALFSSEIVINCLWEKRSYFDQMMGIEDGSVNSIRLKYGLVVKADDFLRSIHSLTLIHGPYGNFVINPHNDRAFCSWYPASMKGIMEYGPIPDAWELACDGDTGNLSIELLRKDNLEGFQKYIPQLANLDILKVTAGVILAEGNKDINERDSSFHSRSEFPIREASGYFSISTSKYTSAPRNTKVLEEMLFH